MLLKTKKRVQGDPRGPGGPPHLAVVDFDHWGVLDDDGLLQRIYDAEAGGAIHGGLRGLAAHGDDPWLVKEEFGAEDSGIERQSVVGREGVAQRDVESSIDAGEIAETGEDAGTADVSGAQVVGGLAGPFAAALRN